VSQWHFSLALIVRPDGWVGILSDTIIVLREGYNLQDNPVSDADIRIRILVERFIRNQIHRIGAYPYPFSPLNAYPDNPWARPTGAAVPSSESAKTIAFALHSGPPHRVGGPE